MSEEITGFSKLSKDEKIEWLTKTCFQDSDSAKTYLLNIGTLTANFKSYMMNFLKIQFQIIIYRLQLPLIS